METLIILAALDKMCGPATVGAADRLGSVWQEHYHTPPEPQPMFRKWFREKYA